MFAIDEPEVLEDENACKVTMVKALAHVSIVFNKMETIKRRTLQRAHTLDLFEKADQAFMYFKESGPLL